MKQSWILLACITSGPALLAIAGPRPPAVISMDYAGNRRLDFPPLADRVRLRVTEAPTRIATRIGLVQYQAGFQYPLTVRFVDKIRLADDEFEPRDLGNAPALLRFLPDKEGAYRQDLYLNPNVYFERPEIFDRILDRQLTFVVINEAMGPESLNLPSWIRQGLATYVVGNGDELVGRAVQQELEQARADYGKTLPQGTRIKPRRFLQDLEGEFTSQSQSQYFLAIRYIELQNGTSGLQNFVRYLVEGKSVNDALTYSISMDLDTFKQNVRTYSLQVFDQLAKGAPH
jgi:hypothetical protein